jgi:hypothetical protein
MKAIAKVFKYLAYYRQAYTPELRKEARNASTLYFKNSSIQLRTVDNILSFRRAYISVRRNQIAEDRLKSSNLFSAIK